jgi:Bacterial TSP3 repeat
LLLLLALCAAIALPATASSQSRFGVTEARVVARPTLLPGADSDKDGLTNWTELHRTKTNPRKFDSDGDGFGDGAEVTAGSDPRDSGSTPIGPPASEAATSPQLPAPVDTTPPNTAIDSGPSGISGFTKATFGFSSSEVGSSFECAFDTPTWSSCSPPKTYSSLSLGLHSFSVRATDAAGNTDPSPAKRAWTVEVPPDTTPPNTSIISSPPSTTASTSARFGFSSSESGSSFQCSLDSAPSSGCSSLKSYSALGLGPHTFSVAATDAAGNTDPSPATSSWTVTEPEAPVECTTTLSAGANLSEAVANAAGGTAICLSTGTYSVNVTDADKASMVTIKPAAGAAPSLSYSLLDQATNLRFQELKFTGGIEVLGPASKLQLVNNEFVGPFGIHANGQQQSNHTEVTDVRIDGNYLHDLDYTGDQGTANGYGITGSNGVSRFTITNNTIKSPASDYIQSASPIDWVVDHNTFLGPSLLGDHEDHQDLWQIFGGGEDITFTNNVARNTETQESLLFQEGAFRNVDIENNLFDHDSRGYTCQIYQSTGLIFRDNTIVGSHWGCLFRDLATSAPGSGYEVDHNVFAETEASVDVSEEGRAGDWGTYDYNVSTDNSAEGLHSVRNWSPSWSDTTNYSPLGLPFAAGFSP